jgi:hypothetical protein
MIADEHALKAIENEEPGMGLKMMKQQPAEFRSFLSLEFIEWLSGEIG